MGSHSPGAMRSLRNRSALSNLHHRAHEGLPRTMSAHADLHKDTRERTNTGGLVITMGGGSGGERDESGRESGGDADIEGGLRPRHGSHGPRSFGNGSFGVRLPSGGASSGNLRDAAMRAAATARAARQQAAAHPEPSASSNSLSKHGSGEEDTDSVHSDVRSRFGRRTKLKQKPRSTSKTVLLQIGSEDEDEGAETTAAAAAGAADPHLAPRVTRTTSVGAAAPAPTTSTPTAASDTAVTAASASASPTAGNVPPPSSSSPPPPVPTSPSFHESEI